MNVVSVIIPCYNNSKTIRRALQSVLYQTYSDIEVIVVDDGSSDIRETEHIVTEINDSRIILLKHDVNRNGSAARNTGLRLAKGSYIALLDADDEWNIGHLQSYIDFLTHYKINTSFLLYCRCKVNGISNNYTVPARGKNEYESVAEYLFRNKGFIQTSTMFFPADIIGKISFNENLRRHQDYDFTFKFEQYNIPLYFSGHTGVKIHWTNNDIAKKGGTWEYSLDWVKNNKASFTPQAFSCFLLKNVVWPLLRMGKRGKAMSVFIRYCNLLYIPPVFLYVSIKLFVLKKA